MYDTVLSVQFKPNVKYAMYVSGHKEQYTNALKNQRKIGIKN